MNSYDGSESSDAPDNLESKRDVTLEDRVIEFLLTIGLPLIITFIAFGVIILAYAQWKLY